MKELDLTQFKGLVGDLDSSEASYDLEDILHEAQEEAAAADGNPAMTGETETAEPEPPDMDEAEPEAPDKEKRHIWDDWVIPEEPLEDGEELLDGEEEPLEEAVPQPELPQEEPEDPIPTESLEDMSEETTEKEPEIIAEEETLPPEPEEQFEEKPIKRHFWDRWLVPEEDEEQPSEPNGTALPEQETNANTEQEEPDAPAAPAEERRAKSGFWSKWFAPIEKPKEPEEKAKEPETEKQSAAGEKQPPRSADRDEPTISEEELAAFLQQTDSEPEAHTSFETLLQESGVDYEKETRAESRVVYVELGGIRNRPRKGTDTPFEPEPVWDWVGKTVERRVYTPREFPRPEWMDLTLDRLSEIAPEVERRNGEPVLMTELRWIARQREKARENAVKQAEPPAGSAAQQAARTFVSETAAAEDDGDDGDSGGSPRQDVIHEEPPAPETPEENRQEEPEEVTDESAVEQPEETQEEPHRPKLSAKGGYKKWNRRVKSVGRRSVLVGILMLLALYLSCSATMSLPVPERISWQSAPQNFYVLLIVLSGLAIVTAWDVVCDAVRAILRRRLDFCTLVVLTLAMTLVHCVLRMRIPGEEIAYPCVALAALFALMRARMAQAEARRNTYRAAGSNPAPRGIFLRREPRPHLVKVRLEEETPFLAGIEKDDWYSRFERLYTPLAIVTALVLAALVCTAAHDTERFWYAFSALLTASCQIGLLTAVAFCCSGTTRRLLGDQAALAGLASAVRAAGAGQVVMTEEDLFPAGAVHVDEYVDLRGEMPLDDVLAYAAAAEGDSALGKVLRERIRERYGEPAEAEEAVRYDNGGTGAVIDGRDVLFGTAGFMNDRKIPIPSLPNENEALFLAVDGKTEAVFEVEYTATTQVYAALQSLEERHISVLFQLRDCHLSAEQLSDLFGLRPGMIRLPDTEQLRQLQDTEELKAGTPLAILTRDGAAPYADCVDAACALRRLTAVGTALGLVAAVLDLLLMTYLCYVFAPLSASPLRVLVYSLLWAVPVLFIANETRRG